MSDGELPTVEIDGRPYVAVMMAADEGPSEVLDKARMNMKELAEMIAKLPRDERSELMGTALASIAMACESKVAELERVLDDAIDLIREYEAQWGSENLAHKWGLKEQREAIETARGAVLRKDQDADR